MGELVSLHVQDAVQDGPQRGGNNKGHRRSFGNIRRLPSKRWQASYRGPDGTRHNAPTTFETKGDAAAWLSMESASITAHKWRPAPPPRSRETLATFAQRWLAERELTPRTRAEYTRLLGDILEALGAVELTALTPARVREWYATLDPTKPTARAHRYALLRTVLNSAVRDELLEANPCRIERAAKAKAVKPIRPATADELATITQAMPERYRLMVLLAGWCAVRFGELTELRRRDVDTTTGTIRVRRGVTWVKDGDGIARAVVGLPKTDAGIRDVSVPPPLVPLIVAHLEAHALPGPDGLLFPNTDGHHMHHGSLYKVYRPARAAAGRPDLRWHDLRHTGATLAAQAGATTRELMDRLGHSTAAVAMRYQHVSDGRQAEIARRLGAMMGEQ